MRLALVKCASSTGVLIQVLCLLGLQQIQRSLFKKSAILKDAMNSPELLQLLIQQRMKRGLLQIHWELRTGKDESWNCGKYINLATYLETNVKDLLANKKPQQMIPASYPFQTHLLPPKLLKKKLGRDMLNMGGHEGVSNTEVLP